jgi:hypothetical protein
MGVPTHYASCKPGVLDMFSKYSLKIPQIYSNMLEYARICLNILEYTRYFLVGRVPRSYGRGGRAGGPGRRAYRQPCLYSTKSPQLILSSSRFTRQEGLYSFEGGEGGKGGGRGREGEGGGGGGRGLYSSRGRSLWDNPRHRHLQSASLRKDMSSSR